MKKYYLTIVLLTLFPLLIGQTPVGIWSDHLVYNAAKHVAVSGENVYSSTGYSILVYNKDFAELRKLSPVTGLSETGISTIAWSDADRKSVV